MATVAAAMVLAAGCASAPPESANGPITIARQGSFYVGGRQVTGAGTVDLIANAGPGNVGESF
jgi:hypothetical protein